MTGESYKVEQSHGDSMFRVNTLAVAKERNKALLTFRIVNQINSEKTKISTRKITLKKGEKKTFSFKVRLAFESQRNYCVAAYYEPE